jgi:3-keto-5-aminohexanoate cleavage enzyme
MSLDEKLIVTVAPTGSGPQWKKTPYLPIAPSDIAAQAVEAYEAGAAIAHIHVRDPETKAPRPDVAMYREVLEGIRDKCDMIVQLTTGGGPYGVSVEQRMSALNLKPESASLNVATMTFGEGVFMNPPDVVESVARSMLEKQIKPELECYDVGHIGLARSLVERGIVKEPLRISLVLGVKGGIPATPENLVHMKSLVSGWRWNVIAIGKAQFSILTLGITLGGDVRVGMEDNIYLSKGVLVKRNAELVSKIVRVAKALGKEIATPNEATEILRIPSRE